MSFKYLVILLALSPLSANAVIYGTDDREEVYRNPMAESLARSTAMMISPVYYKLNPRGTLDLELASVSDSASEWLCKDERFADQPADPVPCTGFLIAPTLLLTAGHCALNPGVVFDQVTPWCESFSWLFDYKLERDGSVQLKDIPASRLVGCKRVIYGSFTGDIHSTPQQGTSYDPDFALIELDRPVLDRPVLTLAKTSVKKEDRLFKVGHPTGLPTKVTANAWVQDTRPENYFTSDLDAMSGDSGSPVFNSRNEVVGILVRGFPSADYVPDPSSGGCYRPNRCDLSTGHCLEDEEGFPLGSHIQRVRAIVPHLPRG